MPSTPHSQALARGLLCVDALRSTPASEPPERGECAAGPTAVRSPLVRITATTGSPAVGRAPWVYLKHALMHPWHILVLAGATVFGVANWSILVMLLGFASAELLILGIVLRLRVFRRWVDERLDQAERAWAKEQRASLLAQMGDDHRRELLRFESVLDKIRVAQRPLGTAAQIAVDECQRLLADYVRLAIAFNTSRECLASVDRRALEDDARKLEIMRFSQNRESQALAQQRILIARKRAERWDRSRERLEAIAHRLAMIGELVQLTHEQLAAPLDPVGVTAEIERFVQGLDVTQSTIDELLEFAGADETIEARVLEMGRVARA